jgi:hypothetical protein
MTGLVIALAIALNVAGIGIATTEYHNNKLQQQNYVLKKQIAHLKKTPKPAHLKLHGIKIRNLEKAHAKKQK